MASEFLYILCAGYQVWVAREGGGEHTSQLNNTYPSARPTLSSPLDSTRPTPAPVPVSAMSHPTRHFLKDTRNNPGNDCAATLVSNLCPTRLPHNTGHVADFPDQPRQIRRLSLQLCFTSS